MTMAARRIVIDPERCVGCADCSLICPVKVYRVSPPPCQSACPIGTDVLDYVSLIEQGNFDRALASINKINPFPGIVGRVCTHPCDKQCRRGEVDEPISICGLKRAAAQFGERQPKARPVATKEAKVAIVGSGPAGLMAAHDLAWLGYRVTIFESLPVAGGMLAAGIPEFRLPHQIVSTEVGQVAKLGVEIRLNTRVGKDMTLEALFKQGYKAILLATGAHQGMKLNIPGEDEFKGVEDAITFLREVKLDSKRQLSGKAIVVGGGNAAIDSARTLLRLGCKEANIVYRRSRQEMPAIGSEVVAAEQEGVKIHYQVAPARVLGRDGKVAGLECLRTRLGKADASGRRRPVPVKGSEFSMEAALVIAAVGQQPDLSFGQDGKLALSGNLVAVDPGTMATNLPGMFAAGDVVTGPNTVVDALAAGRRAATGIDRYLRGEKGAKGVETKPGVTQQKGTWWKGIPKAKRVRPSELAVAERSQSFDEVDAGLTKAQAVEEARRCLGCGIFARLDMDSCLACKQCSDSCWKDAITVVS